MFVSFRLPLLATAVLGAVTAQKPIYTLAGSGVGDRLGEAVSGAGDVNGDGFADVIVGAPFADSNGLDSGTVRVLSGADGSSLRTFWGQHAGDQFGRSVRGAGDVNGDGFADLIVGAPRADTNGADSGSAYVLSGANGSTLHVFSGDSAGDQFGWSVSGAGDVDGDGFADLVVGAPFADVGGANSGMARVFSGVSGAVLYSTFGDGAGDRLGWSVSGVGDVDTDCFDDVVVGMPFDDNNGTDSGSVRLLSGPAGNVLWTVFGKASGDRLGWSVSGAGDSDGDEIPDVVAGAPWNDTKGSDAGHCRVLSGVNGWPLFTVHGDAGDNLGWSVGGCGDVDGDGTADVIAGSPRHDAGGTDAGRASVWSGATGQVLWVMDGRASQDYLGWSVGVAGDLLADGYAGLIVGAPQADENGADSGSAMVFARRPFDAEVAVMTHRPAPANSSFGVEVQCVGDVDNDGVADYAVGAAQDEAQKGTVRVYSGANHTVLHTLIGGAATSYFGYSIAAAGDVDSDGYDDFLTGSQHWSAVYFQQGRATLWSGRTGAVMKQWTGSQSNVHMGGALGGLGDIDGDGWGDVFVGVLRQNSNTGMVRVYSGQTGATIYTVNGSQPDEEFGRYGGTVGDVDGDGIPDYVVGAPQTLPTPMGNGYAVVLSGATGRQIWRFDGLAPGDGFGYVCAGAGDVDGDGIGDVIVGGHNHDPQGRIAAGMARVFSGATGAMLYHYDGKVAGDHLGIAVNGAGDVNGDGHADFLIGAPGSDFGAVTGAGAAYLHSGVDGSLLQLFEGTFWLQELGTAVAGLPDLTGDGFADVVIGVPGELGAGANAGAAIAYKSTSKSNPGSLRRYGTGCVGSNGKLPQLTLGGRPVLNKTFDIGVRAAPASTAAWIGFDTAPRNISLSILNSPTCTFWALPTVVALTVTDALGKSQLSLWVPNESSLVGVDLFMQWILADAQKTPLPLVFSNGGWVTIGR